MTTCNNYYCDTCEKEVETEVREITEEFEVKDEKITATIKIRICKICGEEVWDEELEKQNEKIARLNGLCSVKSILKIFYLK